MLTTHNIDIQATLVWLTLPFYNFCGFRSVAVNTVYKLQFFYIYFSSIQTHAVNRGRLRSTAVAHCRTPSTTFNACERGDGLTVLLDFSSVLI